MEKKKRKWTTLIMEEVSYWNDDRDEWFPTRLAKLSDADIAGTDYDISIEISVVREDNKHGLESWGWGDSHKIILFDGGAEIECVADIEWMKKVAKTIADALNKEEL